MEAPELLPPEMVDAGPPPMADDMIAPVPDMFVLGQDGDPASLPTPQFAGTPMPMAPAMAAPTMVPPPGQAAMAGTLPPPPFVTAPPPFVVAQPGPMAMAPAAAPAYSPPAFGGPGSMPGAPYLTPAAPGAPTEAFSVIPPAPMQMAPSTAIGDFVQFPTHQPLAAPHTQNPVDLAFAPLTGMAIDPPVPPHPPLSMSHAQSPETWNLVPVSPGVAVYEYRPPAPPQPSDEVVAQLPPPNVPLVGVGPLPGPQQPGLFPEWQNATHLEEPAQAIAYPAPYVADSGFGALEPLDHQEPLDGYGDAEIPESRGRQMIMLAVLGVVAVGAAIYAAVTFLM